MEKNILLTSRNHGGHKSFSTSIEPSSSAIFPSIRNMIDSSSLFSRGIVEGAACFGRDIVPSGVQGMDDRLWCTFDEIESRLWEETQYFAYTLKPWLISCFFY